MVLVVFMNWSPLVRNGKGASPPEGILSCLYVSMSTEKCSREHIFFATLRAMAKKKNPHALTMVRARLRKLPRSVVRKSQRQPLQRAGLAMRANARLAPERRQGSRERSNRHVSDAPYIVEALEDFNL